MSAPRKTRRQPRRSHRKPTGRLAGTRARGPGEAPSLPHQYRRHLFAVTALLLALAAIAAAPHALVFTRNALREEPFLLADVQVRGLERLTPSDVRTALDVEAGTPLVAIDAAAAETRLAAHPWIAEATVLRFPPDALRVHVVEEVPLAVVPVVGSDALHAVNARGVPFAPAGEQDVARLVHVALAERPEPGAADARLLEALTLGASLRARGLAVPRNVRMGLPERDESAEIRLRGFAPAIWIERDRHAEQLDRLATLLAANLKTASHAKLIDLRFADRAVLWAGE